MSNPVDEYLSAGLPKEKRAAPFGQLPLPGMARFLRGNRTIEDLGSGALQAAGGLAVTGLVGAAGKIYQAINKKRDFENMMDVNPALTEMQEADPKRFNHHYNSMRTMSPELAKDPVISANIMYHMGNNPEGAGKILLEYMRGAPTGPTAEVGPKGMSIKGVKVPGSY